MNWHYRPAWTQLALKRDLICAEIGTLKGTNAHYMLSNLNIKKIYLIDPFFKQVEEFDGDGERPYTEEYNKENHNIAKRVLKGFEDKITWLVGTTEQVINKILDDSLDFCYIDGCHEYEFVKKDIELCLPKIKIGGVLGGHDFCNDHPGVVKAVIEYFGKDKVFVGNRDWWSIKV